MALTLETNKKKSQTVAKLDSGHQAYMLLYSLFIVVPVVAGADKFFQLLVNWDQYLSPIVAQMIPAHPFMLGVGVVEIIAGILVAVKPRIGSLVVAAWLAGIVVNLLTIPGHFDVAFRDFGLCLSAIALFRLSNIYCE